MRILLFTSLALSLSAQDPITVQAPIQKVRLYPNEAWITRSGKVQLPGAGTHRILIKDLPLGLRVEDLQASARGLAGLRLGDLSVKSEVRVVKESLDWKKLEAEREALTEKREALEIELEAQKDATALEVAYLKNIQATHDKEISMRLSYTTPNVGGILELGKGIQGRMAELTKALRLRDKELRKIRQSLDRVNAEMNGRSNQNQPLPSVVQVEITSTQPGLVEVEMGYRSHLAGWRPSYEARLSEDRKQLNLLMYASVSQKTGEAWDNVRIEISNARPAMNLSLASYSSARLLSLYTQPVLVMARESKSDDKVAVNYSSEQLFPLPVGATSSEAMSLSPGISGYGSGQPIRGSQSNNAMYRIDGINVVDEQAGQATATLIEEARGLTKTFLVEGSKDVPSDGEPHRFKVLAKEVEPRLVVFAAPRLDPNAFLLARFPAPEGLPLFPGSVVVRFAGNQRLGEAPLVIPPAGQSFSLGFGPYKSIRTSFRKGDPKMETLGTFSKERQWTLAERMELNNDGGEELSIEVQDRILKSGAEEVKVQEAPGFSEGSTEEIPGVRTWKFNLAPKSHKTLELPVIVKAPKDAVVAGLEGITLGQP